MGAGNQGRDIDSRKKEGRLLFYHNIAEGESSGRWRKIFPRTKEKSTSGGRALGKGLLKK